MPPTEYSSRLTHGAFAALGNPIRLEIIHVLWMEGEMRFNELYAHVDVDDTGQFSYHLDQLREHFVTTSGQTYRLTNAGKEIVMTILAHIAGSNPFESPHRLDATCHSCEAHLHAVSAGGWLRIDCPDCTKLYSSFPIPIAGLTDRSAEEYLVIYDNRIRRQYALVHRGSCPNCSCEMSRTVVHEAEPEPGLPFVFRHRCAHCRLEIYSLPGTGLLDDPAVIAFYHQAGIDLFARPHWELDWLFDGRSIELLDDDPLTYQIDIQVDNHTLTSTLDEAGNPRTHTIEQTT